MADSIYTARRPTHPRTARRPTHPHTARRPSMTYKARRPTTGGALYLGWRWSRATRCRGHLRLQRGAGTTAGTNGEGRGRRPRLLLLPSPSSSLLLLLPSPSSFSLLLSSTSLLSSAPLLLRHNLLGNFVWVLGMWRCLDFSHRTSQLARKLLNFFTTASTCDDTTPRQVS